MVTFRVTEEEVALLNAFRLLTTRQRQMILRAVIGITSGIHSRFQVVQGSARQAIPDGEGHSDKLG